MATTTFDSWGLAPSDRVGYLSPPCSSVYDVTERMVTLAPDGVEPATPVGSYWINPNDPTLTLYLKV